MLSEVRELWSAGARDRHEARQVCFGRLCVNGVVAMGLKHLIEARESVAGDDDDLQVLACDLLGAHDWVFDDDGKLFGPMQAPAPEAPFYPEKVAALAGGPGGDPGPLATGDPADLLVAGEAYSEWLRRVRTYQYWKSCQERRALIFGRAMMPDDPRGSADFLWEFSLVAGENDVQALWTPAVLELDYGAAAVRQNTGAALMPAGERRRVEVVSSYRHGPAPESDGIRTWPCRLWAHGDPGHSPECERVQIYGAGYICDPCARADAARWRRAAEGGKR